jgi:ribonuclease HI
MSDADNAAKTPLKGIVIYSDGGCRPNPGPGGWGIHGYMYSLEAPKKGSGNPEHVLTSKGYMTKAMAAMNDGKFTEVTPIHYIDGYGSFAIDVTNNVAELAAATNALIHAAEYDVQSVLVLTDSEYTRKGLEMWVIGWARNQWVKSDGSEIANVGYWKRLVEARDVLKNRGVDVQIQWVKGHDDILGNELADKLATIAVMTSRRSEDRSHIDTTTAEGYWKYEPDRNPMISHRRMYFNTQTEFNRPGEYYIGDHGKDDELLGKRISDGAYAVIKLEQPDPVLEMVRAHQIEIAGETDSIVMALLDQLYRPDRHKELTNYGTFAIEQPNPYRLDLLCMDREPLTRELRPPRLAMRAVEAVEGLAIQLQKYLNKDASIVTTDLTSILYETTVKVDKKGVSTTIMKLKPEYNVGFARLEVDANYQAGDEVASASVILTLGIDMLDRNSLRRLEGSNPKVTLISWNEAPNVFRYATVVEAGNDKGIWAGVYSNLRIVT